MITYHQAHRQLGVASDHLCPCGKPAFDWAYQHTAKAPLIEDGRHYSSDPTDYIAMCRGCHLELDYSMGTRRGWATMWENPTAEFLANNADAARRNGIGARARLAELQTDPMEGERIKAQQSEGAKRGGCGQRRRCLECGREMNAVVMGRHQKTSGHVGLEDVK